jgi:hypothetical protein
MEINNEKKKNESTDLESYKLFPYPDPFHDLGLLRSTTPAWLRADLKMRHLGVFKNEGPEPEHVIWINTEAGFVSTKKEEKESER